MEIYQLRYFLAVVESGSFRKAADLVHVTQPTLSAGIKKLEETVGVTLFERSRPHVRLTAEGEALLPHARSVVREVAVAWDALRPTTRKNRLRLGVLRSIPKDSMGQLVRLVQTALPDEVIEVVEGSVGQLSRHLLSGRVDVALTYEDEDLRGATIDRVRETRLGIYLPQGHRLEGFERVPISELHGEPFILRRYCDFHMEARQAFERRAVRPHFVYRAVDDGAAFEYLRAGLGVCAAPSYFNRKGLAFRDYEDLHLTRSVVLAFFAGDAKRLGVLREAVREVMK